MEIDSTRGNNINKDILVFSGKINVNLFTNEFLNNSLSKEYKGLKPQISKTKPVYNFNSVKMGAQVNAPTIAPLAKNIKTINISTKEWNDLVNIDSTAIDSLVR